MKQNTDLHPPNLQICFKYYFHMVRIRLQKEKHILVPLTRYLQCNIYRTSRSMRHATRIRSCLENVSSILASLHTLFLCLSTILMWKVLQHKLCVTVKMSDKSGEMLKFCFNCSNGLALPVSQVDKNKTFLRHFYGPIRSYTRCCPYNKKSKPYR
jgi:hypothetical protein